MAINRVPKIHTIAMILSLITELNDKLILLGVLYLNKALMIFQKMHLYGH